MRLKLDTVTGSELVKSGFDGRYIRTGLIQAVHVGDLPLVIPDPTPIVKAFNASGMPQLGDPLPVDGYDDWIVRRHVIRPVTALLYTVLIFYEWLGVLRIRDTSTLTGTTTQIHPGTKSPLIVKYTRPGANSQQIKRQLNMPYLLPLRHLVISKTVKYEARQIVVDAFGTVNKITWEGLPVGYWLFSGLEGDTIDNGRTFTYSITVSTRQRRDWSEDGWITDDRGNAVIMTAAEIAAMKLVKAKDYLAIYDMDSSVNGYLRTGLFEMSDFGTIFGIGSP